MIAFCSTFTSVAAVVVCDVVVLELFAEGLPAANVVTLEVFDDAQGIAVDTHAKRISNLIGFSSEKEPEKIEHDLIRLIPKEYWKDVNHLLIWHGRNICVARNPKCDICPVRGYCNNKMAKI